MQDYYINELLEIKQKGIIITKLYTEKQIRHVHLELERREHTCPRCGAKTDTVHDYRIRTIKHQCSMGYHDIIHYRRRRYVCPHCNKRFPETNNFVNRYHKISYHTMKLIIHEYRAKQSIKDIGYRLNISYPTIMRHMNLRFRPRRLKLPEVISIDEFKNLKNGFGKYAFIMVDPINRKLIDTFPNRRIDNLKRYFSKIPIQERLRVKIVVSDLWDPYRRLVKTVFPRAKLVADRYHFIRQLYWGLQDVRKRIMRQYKTSDFEYYILKKYWRFILKYTYNLSYKHFKDYRLGYHVTPKQIVDMARTIDDELKLAIDLKDEFYELLHTTSYNDSSIALRTFIEKLKNSSIPEYFYVAKTYDNWFTEICNSFLDPRYNNGFIEGLNNKVKVIKRIAFGYRNFHNFKSRIFALTSNDLPLSYSY